MMNINTWHKPALTPAFVMPVCAPTSRAAYVRVVGVQTTGIDLGTDAWSPPLS